MSCRTPATTHGVEITWSCTLKVIYVENDEECVQNGGRVVQMQTSAWKAELYMYCLQLWPLPYNLSQESHKFLQVVPNWRIMANYCQLFPPDHLTICPKFRGLHYIKLFCCTDKIFTLSVQILGFGFTMPSTLLIPWTLVNWLE